MFLWFVAAAGLFVFGSLSAGHRFVAPVGVLALVWAFTGRPLVLHTGRLAREHL